MNFNYLKPGVGNAASYQVAGIPWYTSSVAPALSTTSTVVNLPQVTKFVTIKNKSTTDDSLRITFNNESVVDNDNYFLLEAGESFSADFRVTDIHLISDNETPVPFTIVNGLTNIQRQEMTQTTPKAPNLLAWIQKQKLFVEEQLETTSDIRFGQYVRTTQDENKIFISARYEDGPSGESRAGAVYVFENINGEFIRTQKILPPSNVVNLENFRFGTGLEINGDGTKIVHRYNNNMYISEIINNNYELVQTIPLNDEFYWKPPLFSPDSNTIIATDLRDSTYVPQAGSLQIFVSSSSGYQQNQYITASYNIDGSPRGTVENDSFGFDFSVTQNFQKLFISAIGDNEAGGANAGAVYIFQSSSIGYQQVQKLTASFDFDGNPELNRVGDRFGISLASSADGSVLAVGADFDDENGDPNAGAVYIFQSSSAGYQQVQKISASFNTDGTTETSPERDNFGDIIDMSENGSVLLISATNDEEDGGSGDDYTGYGAIYVYISSSAGYVQQDKLISLYNTDGTLEAPTPSTRQIFTSGKLLKDGKTFIASGRNSEFGYNAYFPYIFKYTRDY